MENYIEAYNRLNIYEKMDILNMILQKDVVIFFEEKGELTEANDLLDNWESCINGTQIQITVKGKICI